MNRESCQQHPNTVTETVNMEKQEPSNRIKTQKIVIETPHKHHRTNTNTGKKINVETSKRRVSEKKILLASLYNRLIGLLGRVFANGPEDLGSIPGRVIPKTFKMVLDTFLLNTQQYKVRIEGKLEQSRERSSALPYTSV